MGRYPLSTIINGKKYVVHVVEKVRKDFKCAICEEGFELEQAYIFIDEPNQKKAYMCRMCQNFKQES